MKAMRVNIVCGADPSDHQLAQSTYEVLADQMNREKAFLLAEENPDMLHVVGAWDAQSIALAKHCTKRHIPFVHTPLGSLSPWYKPTVSQTKLSDRACAIVASGVMEQKLLSNQGVEHLQLILNAVTTKTTTPSEMAYEYMMVYAKNAKTNDMALWAEIDAKISLLNEDDKDIVTICRNLLYAKYLYEKENIPKKFLSDLTVLLESSDYDEDHFADVLRLITLHDFTARMEYLLGECAGLAEGFMPIPMNGDKEARAMVRMVTDY